MTTTSNSLAEIREMFPRCPVCGYRTSLLMPLVRVSQGPSLRVAHEVCAEKAGLEIAA